MKFFIDWAFDVKKQIILDETNKQTNLNKIKESDLIFTENMPVHKCIELERKGIQVFRIDGRETKKLRDELKLEKTDENDAFVIKKLYESFPEKFKKFKEPSPIKSLVALRNEIQAMRIASSNRCFAINGEESIKNCTEALKDIEKSIDKDIAKKLKGNLIWEEYLSKIKGIGPTYASELISGLESVGIGGFNKPSSLRHYCGIASKDGKPMKLKAGESASYSPHLKMLLLGKIADGLIMSKNEHYRKVYDDYKNRKGQTNPELTAGHLSNMAKRKMVQQFMTDLWVIWRQLEGFSTRPDYVHGILGHDSYTPPSVIPERLRPFNSVRE